MPARTAMHEDGAAGGGPVAAPDQGAVALCFAGVSRPLMIADGAEVIAGIATVTRGWTWVTRPADAADGDHPVGQVARAPQGFDVTSSYVDTPFSGLPVASTVCAALADVAEAWAEGQPEVSVLHAAAVEVRGQVAAFVGRSRAGKSTLVARLGAQRGLAVYCDDMLPVNPDGTAVALGIAPRIRLPLPARASPVFRAHVAEWGGLADDSYAFLPTPNLAPHGTRAPLGTLVWLDRRRRGKPSLHAVPMDEALARLRHADMQTGADSGARDARLAAILTGVTCLELVYSDLEEAVEALGRLLGTAGNTTGAPVVAQARRRRRAAGGGRARGVADDLPLRRDPLAALRPAPTGVWLVRRNAGGLVHLNAVGAAVWDLLDDGATGAEIADALAEVFPQVDAAQIRADVAGLLGQMMEAGLVHPAERAPMARAARQPGVRAG